jgi:hypothetical protein
MALVFTQLLAEMKQKWSKAQSAPKPENLTAIYEPIAKRSVILDIKHRYMPPQPIAEISLLTFTEYRLDLCSYFL